MKDEQERVEKERVAAAKVIEDARIEKERQDALAPDKDKLLKLADLLREIKMPELSTENGKVAATETQGLLTKVVIHIQKRVKEM